MITVGVGNALVSYKGDRVPWGWLTLAAVYAKVNQIFAVVRVEDDIVPMDCISVEEDTDQRGLRVIRREGLKLEGFYILFTKEEFTEYLHQQEENGVDVSSLWKFVK